MSKKDLKKKTFKGFFWLLIGSSSQSILQILVLSILARLVTPAEFGVIGVATIFLGFSKIFSQLGLGAAIIQRKVITSNHIRTAYTVSLIIGGGFCLLTIVLARQIGIFFNMQALDEAVKYISIIFVIDSFVTVSQSILQRELRMKHFAITELISYLFGFGILGVLLGYMGYGMFALIYAYILQAIIKAVLVSILAPHSLIPYFDKKSFKDLIFFGSGQTVAKIANYFAGQGDNLMVGKMLSATSLGYYSRAYQLMVAPVNLIGQSLNIVLFPVISSIQTDLKKVKIAFHKSVQLVAYASLLISAILIINAKEIVLILLGENWLDVVLPFQILAVGTVFRMSYKISDSIIKALGDVYKRAIYQILYAICIFTFSYFGHFWGIQGVAVGVLISIFINFFFMTNLTLKHINDSWISFIRIHLKPFGLSILVLIYSYGILKFLRSYELNVLLTELLYLFFVLSFIIIIIIKFRKQLGVSEEISMLIDKIKKR